MGQSQCPGWLTLCETTDVACQGDERIPFTEQGSVPLAAVLREEIEMHLKWNPHATPHPSFPRKRGSSSFNTKSLPWKSFHSTLCQEEQVREINTNPGWEAPENQHWLLPGKKYDLSSLKWHFDSCLMIPVILTESFLLTWALGTSWIWSHQSLY